MATGKVIKNLQEHLKLNIQPKKFLSYADYENRADVFSALKIKNDSDNEVVDVVVSVTAADGLLLPTAHTVPHIPYASTVEVPFDYILSPDYFITLDEVKRAEIEVVVQKDKSVIFCEKVESTVLPFDFWCGLEGDALSVATLVRPRLADCDKILMDAIEQLKKWKADYEIGGYALSDKNKIRQLVAAIFLSIKRVCFEKSEEIDLTMPVKAGMGSPIKEKRLNVLQLGLFACACLERAKLHPVLLVGKSSVAVGAWLYDSCFLDGVGDDMERIGKYAADGINNLSLFDVDDLFDNQSIGYPTAEMRFLQKLQAGGYETYVDIRRARIDNLRPLPLRVKAQSVDGYEIISESEMSGDAPRDLPKIKKLKPSDMAQKNRQWERRLLDLSLKNTLLNFNPKRQVLHVVSSSLDDTLVALMGNEKKLIPCRDSRGAFESAPFGDCAQVLSKKALVTLENENGMLRTFTEKKEMNEVLSYLVRRGKEAGEESGARVLYAAFGFLKWVGKLDGKEKYAPLVLQPVTIKKLRGVEEYAVVATDDDFSVNATLLEFLKQEFDVDVRGLGGDVSALKISEILAMVKMEIVNKKGWDVYDDCYLAMFSFSRYLMWNDVRRNIGEFKKNPLISSLLNNRNELKEGAIEPLREDEISPLETLTPLTADSSQYEAIAYSQTGKTFVLHGPPGTGKSQTITNVIANAVNDGKRVLFVAEKQAALDVVKKRLDFIGIGEFCLELYATKTDKGEFVKKLENTLALAENALPMPEGTGENGEVDEVENQGKTDEEKEFLLDGKSIEDLRALVDKPLAALHKKRRLGLSLYEALIGYLQNKNAPEILNIESTFYDSLTEEKLKRYQGMLLTATASAKECGGVHNSPFLGVNLTEYSTGVRDSVYCASEVMLVEIKHLKNFLGLFLELYRQRISTFTRKKMALLQELAHILESRQLDEFFRVDEGEFYQFFNANRRLDALLEYYDKHFKKLVDIKGEYPKMGELLEAWQGGFEANKVLSSVVKKLRRVEKHTLDSEDMKKYLETVYDIYTEMDRVKKHTDFSKKFTGLFGEIDHKKRAEFLRDFNHLHDIGATLFMDYNADSFNSMCHRAVNGYSMPVLEGLENAVYRFEEAENRFCAAILGREEDAGEDLFDYYNQKASALIDNVDMLANWCSYKATAKALKDSGLTFIVDAMEGGKVSGENIISAFRKNVYRNFLDINIPADDVLSHFSASVFEETVEQLRLIVDKFNLLSAKEIRNNLIKRLPSQSSEGALRLELVAFTRALKGKLRGMGIRNLFKESPELMKVVAPCMLMSPLTVAQYLQPSVDFDVVIFDEASQLPTAEAIGALARAKSAIIVGDPKQLPPTAFFTTTYVDEENLENEDMESILDDALALGVSERSLLWHYRSKHESLIAFSNHTYYDGKLCTFPSPDALTSKVKFVLCDGVYDRGATKRNEGEANKLIAEVVRRLKDPVLCRSSMGIVTFSNVQKEYIERKLTAEIAKHNLEEVAYEREEPLFVKNLENVQGDERDVVLFSVGYGPDRQGKLSLNFGPLNQAGGWRRLNVAVSRAREEMVVFSSMTSSLIDLSRTSSKGVAGLKAFLEFAQKGRTTLAVNALRTTKREGVGKYIADELSSYGYDCRLDVGASNFKIDIAVVDPKNKSKFILAIILDGATDFSVKDRNVLQIRALKRANWNVLRLFSVNYYNNPKREIKKVKELLDKLTGKDKKAGNALTHAKRPYRKAKVEQRYETAAFVTDGNNDSEIVSRLKQIVTAEEPISHHFLKKRLLATLGITKSGSKVDGVLDGLIATCAFKSEQFGGETYYYKNGKYNDCKRYRVEEGEAVRKVEADFTPYDTIAVIRAALEDKVALYVDEVIAIVTGVYGAHKTSDKMSAHINACIALGEERGLFVRSVSDRITLA